MFLNESITAEEFKRDLEAEAERSEIVEDIAGKDALGTQTSEMEVDDVGEDEVVAEDKGSKGGRKRAPSLPPKLSRKRTHALTAVVSKPIVIERTDSSASAVTSCERCRQHNIKCTPNDVGARCLNCKAKHYKCSLVPMKEGLEMKTTPSGARLMRIAVGGPTKVQEKKEAAKKAKAFHGVTLSMFFFLFFLVFADVSFQTQGVANSLGRSMPLVSMGELFKTREGLRRSIDTLQWRLEAYNNKLRSVLNKREACSRSLKQLEAALADAPSTDEEKEIVAIEQKAEMSKPVALRASSCDEEDKEEESEEDTEEEDELVGSSGMSVKAKGKGRAN